jgi:predicted RNA-binding protein with RPS1 domain
MIKVVIKTQSVDDKNSIRKKYVSRNKKQTRQKTTTTKPNKNFKAPIQKFDEWLGFYDMS